MLFIVLDDTGFGQLGCYGGLINAPNLDALAKDGLRYSNMHTTALCSPSRSCSPVMLAEDYKPPFAFTGTVKKAPAPE